MNPKTALAGIFSAATLSVVAGLLYIVDCRVAGGQIDKCWLTGLPIAGIGGAAGGAFKVGYETLNPSLRSRSKDS